MKITLVASACLCCACGPSTNGPVSPLPSPAAVAKADDIVARQNSAVLESDHSAREKLKFQDLFFVRNETWTAGNATPLGTIFVVKRQGANDKCEPGASRTLQETEHFIAASLDQPSKPERLRSIVVDRSVAAQLDVLSFVSGDLKGEDVLALTMTTEPRSVVRDTKWSLELGKLKTANLDLWKNCFVGIVTNMTKRTLTYRKYSKLQAGASGGAYGLKVGSNYYTSDLDEEVSYVFGLNIVQLDPPKPIDVASAPQELQPATLNTSPVLASVRKLELRNQ